MLAGALGMLLASHHISSQSKPRGNWMALDPARQASGDLKASPINVAYKDAALFADVSPPDVTAFNGTAKFLRNPTGTTYLLGYKASIALAEVPSSQRPDKYNHDRAPPAGGSVPLGWTISKVDHFSFEAELTFVLKDKDGFTLSELTSGPIHLSSGVVNTFQATATPPLTEETASRVAGVSVQVSFDKCDTCETPADG